ncbi:hypothetical protein VNO80_09742 [Phaseolus coccineus]|uniref:Uncharacterized protein n=1 Tax=Phaseolus coccineus TaxID=3886 RepID=A0AAN9N6S4_PHACN
MRPDFHLISQQEFVLVYFHRKSNLPVMEIPNLIDFLNLVRARRREESVGALFDRACLWYLPSGLDKIKSFVVRRGFNPVAGVGPQAYELALQKKRALHNHHWQPSLSRMKNGQRAFMEQLGLGRQSTHSALPRVIGHNRIRVNRPKRLLCQKKMLYMTKVKAIDINTAGYYIHLYSSTNAGRISYIGLTTTLG